GPLRLRSRNSPSTSSMRTASLTCWTDWGVITMKRYGTANLPLPAPPSRITYQRARGVVAGRALQVARFIEKAPLPHQFIVPVLARVVGGTVLSEHNGDPFQL